MSKRKEMGEASADTKWREWSLNEYTDCGLDRKQFCAQLRLENGEFFMETSDRILASRLKELVAFHNAAMSQTPEKEDLG